MLALSTSPQEIVGNALSSNSLYKIYSLYVSNITSSSVQFSMGISRNSGTLFYLAYQVVVPANSSIVAITKDSGVYLNETDSLKVLAAGTGLQAVCSYEIIG
jgi:hypothetical protein